MGGKNLSLLQQSTPESYKKIQPRGWREGRQASRVTGVPEVGTGPSSIRRALPAFSLPLE